MRGKAAIELSADSVAVQRSDPAHRLDGLLFIVHDETCDAVLQNLRHGTIFKRDYRRTAGHRLDHHQAEGLAPGDWKQ